MAPDESTPYPDAYREGDAAPGRAPEPPADAGATSRPLRWKLNLGLFLATVVSVFFTGAFVWGEKIPEGHGLVAFLEALPQGWPFAVPLLTILLTHEFGHYIAARVHRVDASLPFFIPAPLLSPFGTM